MPALPAYMKTLTSSFWKHSEKLGRLEEIDDQILRLTLGLFIGVCVTSYAATIVGNTPALEGWTVTEVTTQSALTRRSISKKKKLNARETIRAIPLTPAS